MPLSAWVRVQNTNRSIIFDYPPRGQFSSSNFAENTFLFSQYLDKIT